MTAAQIGILALLGGMMALFVWGRWRHDVVAFAALIVAVLTGLVPADQAFSGFANPAVVTVAFVLILSRGLQQAGSADFIARHAVPRTASPVFLVLGLAALGAALSGFMNNVGALALLMPVAIQASARANISPAVVLMPLSFATLLGGLTTLIGTPPNLLIAQFRAERVGSPFAIFDFAPVGVPLTVVGVAYLALLGWRLLPGERRRSRPHQELFEIEPYLTEAKVPEKSKSVGRTLRDIEALGAESRAEVVSLVRGGHRVMNPGLWQRVFEGDVLVVRADADALDAFIKDADLALAAAKPAEEGEKREPRDTGSLVEAVVGEGGLAENRTAAELSLRDRYGVNLLAVSRRGRHIHQRLAGFRFRVGDVLLLQGEQGRLAEAAAALGCIPLAERGLKVGRRGQAGLASLLFVVAVGAAAFELLPVAVAFGAAALVYVLARVVPLRELYQSVDWSIVVLLAALMPVGAAVETTGAAAHIAEALGTLTREGSHAVALGVVVAVTMLLSALMNNAATVILMAPVALQLAGASGAAPDAYLMAVAIGASCDFLTPIGHQCNTIIMGPGGYRFGDYWRVGLPLTVLVVVLSVPLLLLTWPP